MMKYVFNMSAKIAMIPVCRTKAARTRIELFISSVDRYLQQNLYPEYVTSLHHGLQLNC